MNESYSTYLFATPGWKEGAARLLDFGSTFDAYNDSPSPEEADLLALRLDFEAVGREILRASERVMKRNRGR